MVAGGPGAFQQESAELVRVMPLAREVFRGFGVRLVLISLEIWSGWMDLRYVLLPEDQPGAQHLIDFDWQVSDDAGTGYQLMGMATGGGRLLHIYQLGFKPAPGGGQDLTLRVADPEQTANPLVIIELELTAGDWWSWPRLLPRSGGGVGLRPRGLRWGGVAASRPSSWRWSRQPPSWTAR